MMSIIIRLQNLPWEANSMDIRRYFLGLTIPEGGVHIVGGEKGDAFIAFASDEDARQAMLKDGGKIKDSRIKLFLSSRNEMQRCIEMARAAHLAAQDPPPVIPPPTQIHTGSGASDLGKPKDTSRAGSRERRRSRSRDRRRSPDRRRRSSNERRSRRSRSRSRGRRRSRSPARISGRRSTNEDRKPNRRSPPKGSGLTSDIATTASSTLSTSSSTSKSDNIPIWDVNPAAAAAAAAAIPNLGELQQTLAALQKMPKSSTLNPPQLPPFSMAGSMHGNIPPQSAGEQRSMGQPDARGPMFNNTAPNERPNDRPNNFSGERRDPRSQQSDYRGGRLEENRDDRPRGPGGRPDDGGFRGRDAPDYRGRGDDSRGRRDDDRRGSRYEEGRNGRPQNGADTQTQRRQDIEEQRNARREKICYAAIYGLTRLPLPNDVKHFFFGISFSQGTIRVETDPESRQNVLLLSFKDEEDLNIALAMSGTCFGGMPVTIERATAERFQRAPMLTSDKGPGRMPTCRFNRPGGPLPCLGGRAIPKPEDLVVLLTGLPFETVNDDVANFFEGIPVVDVYVDYNAGGGATGIGFAKLRNGVDMHNVLSFSGKRMGHRIIDVMIANQRIWDELKASREGKPLPPMSFMAPYEHGPGPMQEMGGYHNGMEDGMHTCISIDFLPPDVSDFDIADFFRQMGLTPRTIHIRNDPNPRGAGHAFVEFSTPMDCKKALTRQNALFGQRHIGLQTLSSDYMNEVLCGRRPPPPPMMMPPVQRPFMPHPSSGLLPAPMMNPNGGSHGPMNGSGMPPHPQVGGPMHMGPNHQMPPSQMAAPVAVSTNGPMSGVSDGFERPGCVVALSNVPFRAGIEDFLEFFREYNIRQENVMRRFNERNQPTGDARVALETPEMARDAIAKLNGKLMLQRAVHLELVTDDGTGA